MSEPMSSGEIEDVLSSIRRLVSEDLRPVSSRSAAPAKSTMDQAGKPQLVLGGAELVTGKLLLTPAFRVVSNDVPVSDAINPATDAASGTAAPAWGAEQSLVGAPPKPSTAEDWLPESSTLPEDDVFGELPDESDDWLETDDADDAVPPPASDVTRLVSEIGAAVAENAEEWEPEAGDSPMAAMSWQAPEWVEEAEVVDAAINTATGTAAATALADAAEAAAVAEIMSRAAQAAVEQQKAAERSKEADASDDLFAENAGYFDETVLRDLVRDLIREELSGTLGERITRNVRKLVRSEINRAMTARDFE
ncbi:hypothetical protein SAMN05216227_101362 [Pseudorhodobacter antarcticus]|uniref:Uncharacterized protein n=2 Tax=Pseudorhodobacter antarcticus TaxID=1077947 RepID=A0A1H8GB00_9RHOB|nr:hypothetical protein [Pseudorhodobacter antarcticus]SEN40925.1 hypothetical protein SAMN05216227_101362 [Pseudorhodobacter antarcticus]